MSVNDWWRLLGLMMLGGLIGGCPATPPPCILPSVRYMGQCIPPCIENGVNYCVSPDGSIVMPMEGGSTADADATANIDRPEVSETDVMEAGINCSTSGLTNCGGMCVNTANSTEHCGGCEMACPMVANGNPSCTMGTCGIAMCAMGFANCDMVASNGCEANLQESLMHCGACGMACPAVAHGTPTCTLGVCGASCNMGFELLGGVCVAAGSAPRPIAPLSLGDVTLRRPTLRWVLPEGLDGAVVELCRDRACMQVIESIRAVGTTARPTMPLAPRSVVFWRLRGTVGMATSMNVSPTWLFHVPTMDASSGVDTSFNAHLDVNGDGFDDVAVGSQRANGFTGSVRVFLGSARELTPSRTLLGAGAFDEFGSGVAAAGDVNGDGYGELIVGSPRAAPRGVVAAGRGSIFSGGPAGLDPLPMVVLEGVGANDGFGQAVSSAGDLNGDGYGDVIVGAVSRAVGGELLGGRARIFVGSRDGIVQVAIRTIAGTGPDRFGAVVVGVGDVNGDGLSDVAIGAPAASFAGRPNAGAVQFFYGSRAMLGAMSNVALEGNAAGDLFGSAVNAGDINNDGYSDVVVGSPEADPLGLTGAGVASIFVGGNAGISPGAIAQTQGTGMFDNLGAAVCVTADVTGDEFGEVLIGAPSADPGGVTNAGAVRVLAGRANVASVSTVRTILGVTPSGYFGFALSALGDVNGDNFADIAIGAPESGQGQVVVYNGSIGGLGMMPNSMFLGMNAADRFGYSIAQRSPLRRQLRSQAVLKFERRSQG